MGNLFARPFPETGIRIGGIIKQEWEESPSKSMF
jgi:hypothetical protein